MSRTYDNWERLVAAVLRRELIWQICHENSRTPSLRSSVSSDFTSSFRLSSSFSDELFRSLNPKDDAFFKSAQSLPFQTLADIKVRQHNEEQRSRLQLFTGSHFVFSLEELFMAPSIVLGDEIHTFRNTYIVRLKHDTMLVVKRLERENIPHDIFEQKMNIVGSIEHENVVKLRGTFYLSENEIFGFSDYFPQRSLSTLLHGNRVHLDWESRVRIAIGAAKGLVHIHRWSENLVHGNIKASNIFINQQQEGCLADIAIGMVRISRYDAPEVSRTKKTSQESDVYSFGILMLELLSGRSPLNSTGKHKSFGDWAVHNARDEWTVLVFDKEILRHPMMKQGMWDMLALALSCVEKKPEDRPDMNHVVNVLESIYSYCY